MAKNETRFWDMVWPKIADLKTAKKVARRTFWVAVVVSGLTAAVATLEVCGASINGAGAWAYVDAAVFGLIAIGIWKMSRAGAVAGLALYVLEETVIVVQHRGAIGGLVIILIVIFINGVRATFAYHRLRASEAALNSAFPVALN